MNYLSFKGGICYDKVLQGQFRWLKWYAFLPLLIIMVQVVDFLESMIDNMKCILLPCVSAFPSQGISSDQAHQCRDFLLQGSTVQQTWGKNEQYFINMYLAMSIFLFRYFCTVSHPIISPGEPADWAGNSFPVHGGRSVAVGSLIFWGCTGILRGKWRVHRKF